MYFKKIIKLIRNKKTRASSLYKNLNFNNILFNFILIKKIEIIFSSNEEEFLRSRYNVESNNFNLTNKFIKKNKFLNTVVGLTVLQKIFINIVKVIIFIVKFRKKLTIILIENNKYHNDILNKCMGEIKYLNVIGIEYKLKRKSKKKKLCYILKMTKFNENQKKFYSSNLNIFNTLKNLFRRILIPILVILFF